MMDSMNKRKLKYASPVIRVYEDGHVERLRGTDMEPPGEDDITHVASKDIVIDPITGVFARLYLPQEIASQADKKLPILIYYHGGGFCTESVSSPTYHNYLNSLVSHAKVLGVVVEYRLAPEFPLPTGFNDSWTALQWVLSHVNGGDEQWLTNHGDFGRVILAGDSAGGNIAHQMALRAGENSVETMVLIHPGFWGSTAVGSESTDQKLRDLMESFWNLVCLGSNGVDDPFLNPVADGAPSLSGLACKRVLVCVAEMDFLKERGRLYYESLKENIDWEGEVELFETQGEEHVFHLFKPNCDNAFTLMNRLVSFFNARLN